ncbi:MAG: methyltransferase domain-containing protein [Thermoleophilaceae bacterium]|nr:methyltransferase domain-containing protein [Thermoleophilaceae bacterium]
MSPDRDLATLRAEVGAVPAWYHSIELAPGLVTPGFFDLRGIVARLPWPDLSGLRCLDIGTYDGFYAFEMERRGAAEVVAADLGDLAALDWPATQRATGPGWIAEHAGAEMGRGFRIAAAALGSRVERIELSAYDLSPEAVGSFDFVNCGSLLLHLRDPVRALEAIHTVTRCHFMSTEQISAKLSLLAPRTPAATLDGQSRMFQWWVPNASGHRRMLESASFEIERAIRPLPIPFGSTQATPPRTLRRMPDRVMRHLVAGGDGVPHASLLAQSR